MVALKFEIKKHWVIPSEVIKTLPKAHQTDQRVIATLDRHANLPTEILCNTINYVVYQDPTNNFAGYLNYCLQNGFGAKWTPDKNQRSLFPNEKKEPVIPVFPGLKLKIRDKVFEVEIGNVLRFPDGLMPEGQIRKLIADGKFEVLEPPKADNNAKPLTIEEVLNK